MRAGPPNVLALKHGRSVSSGIGIVELPLGHLKKKRVEILGPKLEIMFPKWHNWKAAKNKVLNVWSQSDTTT